MSPAIVGLTLNFRDAERTLRCVQSLLDGGCTLVLVWDNSADGEICAGELSSALVSDPHVHIEVSAENLGFAAGVNRGIAWIRAHYSDAWIFLINNDAMLLPGGAAAMRNALAKHPDAILAYPDIDHNGRILGTIWYQRWLALITFKPLPGSFPYPSGCALLFAPDRWSQSLLDEDFFMYGEDAYLGWVHRGTPRLLHVSGVWVWHEGSASSGVASQFYETRMVLAHWVLARKMAGSSLLNLGLLIAGRGLVLSARAVVRALRYRSSVPLMALWAGSKLAARTYRRFASADRV